ncbi:hypothetical protein PM082_011693 [Marasmius tenuissimus]|nr:hypothetical protein PM082_011693 [Marasmius tenuissimus]
MGLTVHFYSLQAQVRRGCRSICPTGTLTNVPGKRLIGSDVTKLHRKIEEMGQRIRQLEDALAIIQASVSPSEQHPLLRDEYLEIKFPLEASEDNKADQASELSDEVGTLTLDEDGHIRYLGRSGGTESLLDVRASLPIAHIVRLLVTGPTFRILRNQNLGTLLFPGKFSNFPIPSHSLEARGTFKALSPQSPVTSLTSRAQYHSVKRISRGDFGPRISS